MTEFTKSISFIIAAALLAGLAALNHFSNRPLTDDQYQLVGAPFFEEFDSTSAARSLEVSAVDSVTMALQRFVVRNEQGVWVIPSHHNYPAEAADRLAATAVSVMGIVREAFAGGPSDFERLGVFDPLEFDEERIDDLTAIGTRITLRDSSGDAVVDLIVGREAGEPSRSDLEQAALTGSDPPKRYFVRRPDEQQVYIAKLDLDVSTRFSDWIDTDLLRLDTAKVRRLEIDNYELSEERTGIFGEVMTLYKVQGDQLVLNRSSFSDPWQLDGLDPKKEEIDLTPIISALEILSELRIAGVRPKFKFNDQLLLTPDLELNRIPELETNRAEAQAAIAELQDDLEEKGFSLTGSQQKLELASSNGQLQVGTNEGVLYTIQVGKSVEGKESEIEIGGAQAVDDSDDPEELERIANYLEDEKNRYVMIRVSFDESLIGPPLEKPTEPQPPVKPEGYRPADQTADDDDIPKQLVEDESVAEKEDQDVTQDKEGDERDPQFIRYEIELAQYEEAKIEYELALARYEQDLIVRNEAVESGQQLVKELNERFGDWYYVVTGSNLRTLQIQRDKLVKAREAIEEDDSATQFPDLSFPEVNE